MSVWAVLKQMSRFAKAIDQWRPTLTTCVRAKGQHFEQLLNWNAAFLAELYACSFHFLGDCNCFIRLRLDSVVFMRCLSNKACQTFIILLLKHLVIINIKVLGLILALINNHSIASTQITLNFNECTRDIPLVFTHKTRTLCFTTWCRDLIHITW